MTEEARALLGEVETVAVKDGVTRVAARCLHPEVARQRIREAAERALKLKGSPLVLPSPVTVWVAFQRAIHADMALLIPGSQRVDGRTVEWTGEDMPTAYRVFRAMATLAWAAE